MEQDQRNRGRRGPGISGGKLFSEPDSDGESRGGSRSDEPKREETRENSLKGLGEVANIPQNHKEPMEGKDTSLKSRLRKERGLKRKRCSGGRETFVSRSPRVLNEKREKRLKNRTSTEFFSELLRGDWE